MADTHHQTEHERVLADIERTRQAIVESIAQTESIRANTRKTNREVFWYPIIAIGGLTAFFTLLLQLLRTWFPL